MRWWSVWLTVLVATATALLHDDVMTIDHSPLQVNEDSFTDAPLVLDDLPIVVPGSPDQEEHVETSQKPPDEINDEEGNQQPSDTEELLASSPSSQTTEESTEETSEVPDVTTSEPMRSSEELTEEDKTEPEVVEPDPTPPDFEDGSGDGSGEGSDDENGSGDDINDSNNIEHLIVEIDSGSVQGYPWQGNENIISYIDIPYGTISSIFQAATPAKAWDGLHDVKDHNKRCPQLQGDNYVGDIDCLTLSIFKPAHAEDASVLFHIHAENFNTGSGDPSIYGPDYLVANGIILVLPNYRLGPLGFLCVQNNSAPGNMALKDLSLALSWVNNNIKKFGGNPLNIAVSGDGKSGALAGFLALSPMSRDYVSKVIAESGSFLSYWALDRDPTVAAMELYENIRKALEPDSRLEIPLDDLVVSGILQAGKDIEFKPCLEVDAEHAFMFESPYETITTEKIEKTFLLGSATYAGTHEALLQTEDSIRKLNEDFTLLLPNDLVFATEALKNEVGNKVKTQYFGEDAISLDDVKRLSICFTDMGYIGPGIRSARLLVEAGATVFFYEFAFVGEFNRVLESVEHPVEGAVRGDIVGYLFTQDGTVPGELQTNERKMIATLTQLWTEFVKTGTPSTETIQWNKLDPKDELKEEWLLIDAEPELRTGVHVERLPLWSEIYSQHFIDNSHGHEVSPSVYTVLLLQIVFWLGFCRNAAHVF